MRQYHRRGIQQLVLRLLPSSNGFHALTGGIFESYGNLSIQHRLHGVALLNHDADVVRRREHRDHKRASLLARLERSPVGTHFGRTGEKCQQQDSEETHSNYPDQVMGMPRMSIG